MLPANPKLFTLNVLVKERVRMQSEHTIVVMTNGCFDLLHTGHLYFLQNARKLGDHLLVALNSDSSVKALKGAARPVQTELERAYGLAALECVDSIVIFDRSDLAEEIACLRPDIYTKAGDYSLASIHVGERAALEASGAEIKFLPFLAGFSTTALIRKITKAGDLN